MNRFYFGDSIDVADSLLDEGSFDMVYIDPPFFKQKSFGSFNDRWMGRVDEMHVPSDVESFIRIAGTQSRNIESYLLFIYTSLVSAKRVMKERSSIYLQVDDTAIAYVRILMGFVFPPNWFSSHIVWKRTWCHSDAVKNLGRICDHILLYKNPSSTWNPPRVSFSKGYVKKVYAYDDEDGRGPYALNPMLAKGNSENRLYEYKGYVPPKGKMWSFSEEVMMEMDDDNRLFFSNGSKRIRRKTYLLESKGKVIGNLWEDISPMPAPSGERIGYPTQKPIALLCRMIGASTNQGDVVLDFFAGSSTTCVACDMLDRRFVAIDNSEDALNASLDRFYNEGIDVEVVQ